MLGLPRKDGSNTLAEGPSMVKLISWNIAQRQEAWRCLPDLAADVALLQEATAPPPDVARRIEVGPAPWEIPGNEANRRWRAAIARLSDRVAVQWLVPNRLDVAKPDELGVSRLGTLAAAMLTMPSGEAFVAVSMYALWERPHDSTGSSWIYADASAHRLISDLSALVGRQAGHRIIAAGDLNILHGYGEGGGEYWGSRYATVFERMRALGLDFVGPQAPSGRQADPWPDELPRTSMNVPTYHTNRQTPGTATRQLDFVFASTDLVERIRVTALNDPDQWGPSDHCRVAIDILG